MSADDQMKFHPVCMMYPDMPEEEFAGFRDSIRDRGQKHACRMFGDQMIDGKNRYRACIELGIEPRLEQWDGKEEDLIDFVTDENENRRQLTASQRGAVAATRKKLIESMIPPQPKEADGRFANSSKTDSHPRNSRKEAAEKHNVSEEYVRSAERIQEQSPETFEKVKQGEISIPQAKKDLGISKPKPKGKPLSDDHAAANAGRVVLQDVVNEDAPTASETAEIETESREERAAIKADESDESWAKSLPLYKKLSGVQQKTFLDDVLRYRFLERTIDAARKKSSESMNRFRRLGPFGNRVRRFFCVDAPEAWLPCAAPEDGGCGGTGSIPGSGIKCPQCKSYGFWIKG